LATLRRVVSVAGDPVDPDDGEHDGSPNARSSSSAAEVAGDGREEVGGLLLVLRDQIGDVDDGINAVEPAGQGSIARPLGGEVPSLRPGQPDHLVPVTPQAELQALTDLTRSAGHGDAHAHTPSTQLDLPG
jgi:hypothetical protein